MALAFDTKVQAVAGSGITIAMTLTAPVKLLTLGIVTATTTARTGGAPDWNTTETMTQVGSTVTGSAECTTELWHLPSPTSGAKNIRVANTGSATIRIIASSYYSSSSVILDQNTSSIVSVANPALTLNNVPDGSVVVDILGSGFKDVASANSGGTLLFSTDEAAWNTAGQYVIVDSPFENTGISRTGFVSISSGSTYNATGQSFAGVNGNLIRAKFHGEKVGSPTGNVYAKLYSHSGTFGTSSIPTGTALAISDGVDASTFPQNPGVGWVTFSFSTPYTLLSGTNYVIVAEYTGGSAANYIDIANNNTNDYSGNYSVYNTSWAADSTTDLRFQLTVANPVNITFSYTQSLDDVAYIMASFKEQAPVVSYVGPTARRRIMIG